MWRKLLFKGNINADSATNQIINNSIFGSSSSRSSRSSSIITNNADSSGFNSFKQAISDSFDEDSDFVPDEELKQLTCTSTGIIGDTSVNIDIAIANAIANADANAIANDVGIEIELK